MCRGGSTAVRQRPTPWVEWSNYFGTASKQSTLDLRDQRGIAGALIDLEYQRMELIKFNLFDNKTFAQYAGSPTGPVLKKWGEMRLDPTHPSFARVGGNGPQRCDGDLIRHRTLTGICNDIENPQWEPAGSFSPATWSSKARFLISARTNSPEPARRPARTAKARSAADQPQAVHARPDRPGIATRAWCVQFVDDANARTGRRRSSMCSPPSGSSS